VVTVVSRTDPAPELLEQVQAQLEAVGSDENGDGKITVEVNGIWLDLSAMQEGGDFARLMESSQEKLNAAFYLGESTLFLVDDPAGLEQAFGCFRLLGGADPAGLYGGTGLPAAPFGPRTLNDRPRDAPEVAPGREVLP